MIGVAPDELGLVPDSDVKRLAEFGDAVRAVYGADKNLARRAKVGAGFSAATDGNSETFWSAPTDSRSATIELSFDAPITFDRALTMEWLGDGPHIEQYSIEAFANGKWVALHTGSSIGHKKIDKFPSTTATRARLTMISAGGPARIREFQLFNGSAATSAK